MIDALTSTDVVGSLDYLRSPEFAESWRYEAIESIDAVDDATVLVNLLASTASFQYVLASNG